MISSIRLQNFRSYGDASFEFEDGVNIVVGPNASGKTNLLEAVLVLCQGNSFRARDPELIRFDKPWARLDGQFGKHNRILKIISTDDTVEKMLQGSALQHKTFELDDKLYKRLSLERTEPVVLFEPNHLQLIVRGPEKRRLYFDDMLERALAGYKALSAKYRRTLAQRNALLKIGPTKAKQQLFAWDVRLAELAAQIVEARLQLLADINKSISKTYGAIAGRKSLVELVYDSDIRSDNYSSRLLSKLEKAVDKDFARGFTGHGPHREDIVIRLDKQPAAATASRGEMRSLLLALKIFELTLVEKAREQKPIFLLDDVFSELDTKRRRYLVEHLKGYQTILTTTDADTVLEYFSKKAHLLPLYKKR